MKTKAFYWLLFLLSLNPAHPVYASEEPWPDKTGWTVPVIVEESMFQGLLAVDMAQTANIQRYPRMVEQESRWIIGRKPSERSVIIYGAFSSVSHFAATRFLVRYPKLVHVWGGLGIGLEARDVVWNYHLGVRF